MKYSASVLFLVLLIFSQIAAADTFEFAVSDDSAQATYEIFLSNSFSTRISGLYSRVDDARIEFDDHREKDRRRTRTQMLNIGLFNHGQTGPVRTHLGGELFWVNPSIKDAKNGNDQTFGLALGGAIDAYITPELFIVGRLMYSPNILTSGHYNNFVQFNTRIAYQILPHTALFAGYRYLEVRGDDLDAVLFNGPFLGFKFNF